jgi:Xaa-Pro dipeptidase
MEKNNREKLAGLFEKNANAYIYLKGGTVMHRYGTDFEYPFRQESNFLYLTGITEPDFHAIFDIDQQKYILVLPRRDSKYAVWYGYVNPESYYHENFQPDRIIYNDQLESFFKRRKPDIVYCLGKSEADYIQNFEIKADTETLPEALAYSRSVKQATEIEYLREASKIASEAHITCMKSIKPGMMEYEMKAIFDFENTRKGALLAPYGGIHASGASSAILHYVENNRPIRDGDLYLIDAGSEYKGYAADITRTYPANGKFSPIQADIYDVVLQALNETITAARPGIKMEDLHLHACKVILEGLKAVGILRGSIQDMMDLNIFALFFPHGLGHFLGLDTHDVGGYLKGVAPIDRPGLRFLRARRTLEAGMIITIEPGIYFIPALLKPAFEDNNRKDFLNINAIKPLMDFGGIRIEDNLVITADGYENLTKVPKKRSEIESLSPLRKV